MKNIYIVLFLLSCFVTCFAFGNKEPVGLESVMDEYKPFKIQIERIDNNLARINLGAFRYTFKEMSDNKLAYTALNRANYWKVYYLDLVTMQEKLLTKEAGLYSCHGNWENKILVAHEIEVDPNKMRLWAFYIYDLVTGKRKWLFNKAINKQITTVSMFSNKIAYFISESRNRSSTDEKNEWDLVVYNIDSKESRFVTRVNLGRVLMELYPLKIGLSENVLAFMNNDKNRFKTISKGKQTNMTHDNTYIGYYLFRENKFDRAPAFGVGFPVVQGSSILYDKILDDGSQELYVYNYLSKNEITVLSNKFQELFMAYDVFDEVVIWVDPDSQEVHMYNYINKKDKVLFKCFGIAKKVFISSNKIAITEMKNYSNYVEVYDWK